MSSAAEESSTSDRSAGSAHADPSTSNGHPAASTDAGSGEGGFWAAAAGEFDDQAAEKHASKVFALWEIAPSLAQPASGASTAAEPENEDVWSVAGPTEKVESPVLDLHRSALEQAEAARTSPVPETAAAVAVEPSAVGVAAVPARAPAPKRQPERVEADVTGELPALPQSGSSRNLLLAAAAAVVLMVVGGAAMMFSSGPAQPASTPPVAAAPAVTTPALPSVAVAAAEPAAAAPTVAEPAVPEAPAAQPVAAEPPAAAPEPIAEAAPVVEPPAPVAALPPPPPPMRRLRVRTTPPGATLLLDGSPVNNPYDGRLPEGSSHTLTARAEGYQEASQTLELSRDEQVSLRLERIPPPRPEPRADATPRATTPRPATPRARPASSIRPRERASGSSSRGAGFVTESPY